MSPIEVESPMCTTVLHDVMGGPGGVVGVVSAGTEVSDAAPPPPPAASSDLAALDPHPAVSAKSASSATPASSPVRRRVVPPDRLVTLAQ